MAEKVEVILGGFGGQGIVLMGTVLGAAAVKQGLWASGANSYGAQARGSACKAEVIISPEPVDYPKVMEAAVIGVPHERWGETVRAVVVPKRGELLTEEEIIAHCRSLLPSHKKPTSVVFVDSLPRGTFGGKVLKRVLKEMYGKP